MNNLNNISAIKNVGKLQNALKNKLNEKTVVVNQKRYYPGTGSGAGKGGGAGGSIRESGGGLGQYGAAQEESFFHNKQREQLGKIKEQLKKKSKESEKNEKR